MGARGGCAVHGRRMRMGWVGFWLFIIGLGLLLVRICAPDGHGFYPRCGLHSWSGWHCPGCGSLRAMHHLTHGRFLAALDANAMLGFGLAAVLLWGTAGWWRGWLNEWNSVRGQRWLFGWAAGSIVVFTVARNLPWFPFGWLAP